jgi:hypothetical protein
MITWQHCSRPRQLKGLAAQESAHPIAPPHSLLPLLPVTTPAILCGNGGLHTTGALGNSWPHCRATSTQPCCCRSRCVMYIPGNVLSHSHPAHRAAVVRAALRTAQLTAHHCCCCCRRACHVHPCNVQSPPHPAHRAAVGCTVPQPALKPVGKAAAQLTAHCCHCC